MKRQRKHFGPWIKEGLPLLVCAVAAGWGMLLAAPPASAVDNGPSQTGEFACRRFSARRY
jgi:hypothetical protein